MFAEHIRIQCSDFFFPQLGGYRCQGRECPFSLFPSFQLFPNGQISTLSLSFSANDYELKDSSSSVVSENKTGTFRTKFKQNPLQFNHGSAFLRGIYLRKGPLETGDLILENQVTQI